MECHEINHIQQNLPELINSTLCTTGLLARLVKHDVLSTEDEQDIVYKAQTPKEKSRKLYEILQMRTNGYKSVITALHEEGQTGAIGILQAINRSENTLAKVSTLSDAELKQKLEMLNLPDGYLELTLSYLTGGLDGEDILVGQPILHELVLHGANKEVIESCILRGADPFSFGKHGRTLIHYAAEGGNYKILQYLISLGLVIDARDETGITPLLACVFANKNILETVFELLQFGADINAVDNDGNNLFLLACREGWSDNYLLTIIEKGSYPNLKNYSGKSALHMAGKGGNYFIIGFLLTRGLALEEKDSSGNTPLLTTVEVEKSFNLSIRGFLKYYANVNAVDNCGNNLFLLATWKCKQIEELRELVSAGVNSNIRNNANQTALHLAASTDNFRVIEYLLGLCLDIEATDLQGLSPLLSTLTIEKLFTQSAKELLAHGANVNSVDSNGNSLLARAVLMKKTIDELDKIIGFGINPHLVNRKGHTALSLAAKAAHWGAFAYLGLIFDASEYKKFLFPSSLRNFGDSEINTKDINLVDGCGNNLFTISAFRNKSVLELSEISRLGVYTKIKNNDGQTALHLAACAGNYKVVSYLTSIGLDINEKDTFGNTPLLLSTKAQQTFLATVQMLTGKGADIKAVDNDGNNLFALAAWRNKSVPELSVIAELGANLNSQNVKGETAFHHAASAGNFQVIGYLKSIGLDINKKGGLGQTPLHHSAFANNTILETVNKLIMEGADINAVDYDGDNLFAFAALKNKSASELSGIAELGAKLNSQNVKGETAFHHAASVGNFQVIDYFKSVGLDINGKDKLGHTPLHHSAFANNNFLETVKKLIMEGADINAVDYDGNNLFAFAAARNKSVSELSGIAELGANLNVQNVWGKTAFHHAASAGNFQVIDYLKSIGLDINGKDKLGHTPLLVSSVANKNFLATVNKLIMEGADINAVNNDGNNLFAFAAWRNKSVSDLSGIAELGASLNVQNRRGETALHHAASAGNFQVIDYLKSIGFDINKKGDLGQTPLHHSAFANNNFLETVKKLIKEGADINTVDNDGKTLFIFATYMNKSVPELMEIVKFGAATKHLEESGASAFHYAARGVNFALVSYLKSIGLDINHVDNEGCTPMHNLVFAKSNFLESVREFVNNGADINIPNKDGKNLLLYAVFNNRSLTDIDSLVIFGANWKIQNNRGQSVLHLAAVVKSVDVIEYFLLKGADPYLLDHSGNTFVMYVDCLETHSKLLDCLLRNNIKIKRSSVLADQIIDTLDGIDIQMKNSILLQLCEYGYVLYL